MSTHELESRTDEQLIEELESRGYDVQNTRNGPTLSELRFIRKVQSITHDRRLEQFPEIDRLGEIHPVLPALLQLTGTMSEIGELCQEEVKGLTYDDWDESDEAKMKELGDIIVYLMGYASFRGYDIDTCIQMAADDFLMNDRNDGVDVARGGGDYTIGGDD